MSTTALESTAASRAAGSARRGEGLVRRMRGFRPSARASAAAGLVLLAGVDLLSAAGIIASGAPGPSVAFGAADVGPTVAGALPHVSSGVFVAGALVLLFAALRLGRGHGRAAFTTGVGAALSLLASLPALPQAQVAFGLFTVVLGCMVLARAAERAEPPVRS